MQSAHGDDIVYLDRTNYVAWDRSTTRVLIKEFGECHQYAVEDDPAFFEAPAHPGQEDEEALIEWRATIGEIAKMKMQFRSRKGAMFARILTLLRSDTLRDVQASEGYPAILAGNRPRELLAFIRGIVSVEEALIPDASRILEDKLFQFKIGDSESFEAYVSRFEDLWAYGRLCLQWGNEGEPKIALGFLRGIPALNETVDRWIHEPGFPQTVARATEKARPIMERLEAAQNARRAFYAAGASGGGGGSKAKGAPVCDHCHKTGHAADKCFKLHPELIPEWYIIKPKAGAGGGSSGRSTTKQQQSHYPVSFSRQVVSTENTQPENTSQGDEMRGAAPGKLFAARCGGNSPSGGKSAEVYFDSAAEISTFHNVDLLMGVQEVAHPVVLKSYNGSEDILTEAGEFPPLGLPAFFKEEMYANIMSANDIAEKFDIWWDTTRSPDIHIMDKASKLEVGIFEKQGRLWVWRNVRAAMVSFSGLDKVQEMHETFSHPGVDAMRHTMAEGCYLDEFDITSRDITKWVAAGACTACAIGKMVDDVHPPSIHERPHTPGHRIEADIFFLNETMTGTQLAFNITVCVATGYTRVSQINDRSQHEVFNVISDDLTFWRSRNHPVKIFRCDNERAYATLRNYFTDERVQFEAVPPGNHAHIVENKIGTIKRKIFAVLQGLDFKVPRELFPLLVLHVVTMDNLTVNSKSAPGTPYERVYGIKPSARQFMTVPWGSTVVAYEPDQVARKRAQAGGELGMMIGLDEGHSGGIRFLSFARKSQLIRKTFTLVKPQLEMFFHIFPKARKTRTIDEGTFRVPLSSRVVPEVRLICSEEDNQVEHPTNMSSSSGSPSGEHVQEPRRRGEDVYVTSAEAVDQSAGLGSADTLSEQMASRAQQSRELHHEAASVLGTEASTLGAEADHVVDSSNNVEIMSLTPAADVSLTAPPSSVPEQQAPPSVASDHSDSGTTRRRATGGATKRKARRAKAQAIISKMISCDTTGEISTAAGVLAARRAAANVKGRPRLRTGRGSGDPKTRKPKTNCVTRTGRLSKTPAYFEYVGFMSLLAGTRKLGAEKVSVALREELLQFKERNVLKFIKRGEITGDMKRKSINAIGLVDEKSDGRIKARVVGNGKRQQDVPEEAMTSPTASVTTIKTVLGLAARERRNVQVWDVKGAYLHAFRNPETEDVYIWLDKTMADAYRLLDPSLSEEYCTNDGGLFAKVLKALYGLKESSRDWYVELSSTLISLGFRRSEVDKCLFIKGIGTLRIEIVIHVDDLLVTSANYDDAEELKAGLEAKYGELKVQRGARKKYLGMWIVDTATGFRLEQGPMIADLIEGYSGLDVRSAVTPATDNLFEHKITGTAGIEVTGFLSRVMSLMYVARMTRPDILLAVSFLASRVQSPKQEDERKLRRVMNYLRGTLEYGVDLKYSTEELQLQVFTDASYMSHEQGYGHTGNFIEIKGVGMVHCRSAKQTVVTKSSTEAEAVAMSQAEDDLHMVQELMIELTGKAPESVMFTDSEPLMKILRQEFLCRGRSKYIDQHFFSIRDRIRNGDYKVEFVPGRINVADVLSKPITGSRFRHFRGRMMSGGASVPGMCGNIILPSLNACSSYLPPVGS